MAHYLFHSTRDEAERGLRGGLWRVDPGARHASSLGAGDLVLVYLAAPARVFIGRAELASAPSESGVALAHVEEWDPPIPIDAVLARLGPSAKADFDAEIVEISAHEYETVLAIAGRTLSGPREPA